MRDKGEIGVQMLLWTKKLCNVLNIFQGVKWDLPFANRTKCYYDMRLLIFYQHVVCKAYYNTMIHSPEMYSYLYSIWKNIMSLVSEWIRYLFQTNIFLPFSFFDMSTMCVRHLIQQNVISGDFLWHQLCANINTFQFRKNY